MIILILSMPLKIGSFEGSNQYGIFTNFSLSKPNKLYIRIKLIHLALQKKVKLKKYKLPVFKNDGLNDAIEGIFFFQKQKKKYP